MRETDWTAARRAEGARVARPGFSARARTGHGQTLISGDLDAALAALAPGAPFVGLHGLAPDGPHALRIAPDKALLVTPGAARRGRGLARGLVGDPRRRRLGRGRDRGRRRAARPDAGNRRRPDGRVALGRGAVCRAALPAGANQSGLPPACRAAMARGALDLARRGVRACSVAAIADRVGRDQRSRLQSAFGAVRRPFSTRSAPVQHAFARPKLTLILTRESSLSKGLDRSWRKNTQFPFLAAAPPAPSSNLFRVLADLWHGEDNSLISGFPEEIVELSQGQQLVAGPVFAADANSPRPA